MAVNFFNDRGRQIRAAKKKAKPALGTAQGNTRYYPHVADDWIVSAADGGDGTWEIVEDRDDGRIVATIKVNPIFCRDAVFKICNLIGEAPALWQALREAAIHCLNEPESLAEFNKYQLLLWAAAMSRPYEFPSPNPDDEIDLEANGLGRTDPTDSRLMDGERPVRKSRPIG